MEFQEEIIKITGKKIYLEENGKEIARAYIYFLPNSLHKRHFGYMEDVFVNQKYRNEKIGSKLVKKILEEAEKNNCYKIICTSRYENKKVHDLYEKLGFRNHGIEFRINY